MISIDEMQDMLGRMMDELPDVFFRALNGGVNLLPDTLRSPHAKNDDYFILGEYEIGRASCRERVSSPV